MLLHPGQRPLVCRTGRRPTHLFSAERSGNLEQVSHPRRPLLSVCSRSLSRLPVTKGALKVTVELPGGERLNLSNVHLQDAGAQRIKQSQIDQLVGLVRTAGDRQVAEIMGGDFNCTPDSPGFNSKNCLDLRYRRSRAASRSSPGITPRTCGSREKRWTTYFCATLTIGVQTPTNGLRSRTTTWIAVAPITSVSKAGWN